MVLVSKRSRPSSWSYFLKDSVLLSYIVPIPISSRKAKEDGGSNELDYKFEHLNQMLCVCCLSPLMKQ